MNIEEVKNSMIPEKVIAFAVSEIAKKVKKTPESGPEMRKGLTEIYKDMLANRSTSINDLCLFIGGILYTKMTVEKIDE